MDKRSVSKSDVTDPETGEILMSEITENIAVGKEPDFVKLYKEDFCRLFNLSTRERAVYDWIIQNMDYNNMIPMTQYYKQAVAEATNSTEGSVNVIISTLKKLGLIIAKGRGAYLVNPNYAAKGEWKDIKAIRVQLDYNNQGRQIKITKLNKYGITVKEEKNVGQ